jgi:hypothetical protein
MHPCSAILLSRPYWASPCKPAMDDTAEPAMMLDVVIAHSFGKPVRGKRPNVPRLLRPDKYIVPRDKHRESNDFNIHR